MAGDRRIMDPEVRLTEVGQETVLKLNGLDPHDRAGRVSEDGVGVVLTRSGSLDGEVKISRALDGVVQPSE